MKVRDLINETKEHGTGSLLLIHYSNYLDSDVEDLLSGVDISNPKEWFWISLKVRFDYYRERERIKFSERIKRGVKYSK